MRWPVMGRWLKSLEGSGAPEPRGRDLIWPREAELARRGGSGVGAVCQGGPPREDLRRRMAPTRGRDIEREHRAGGRAGDPAWPDGRPLREPRHYEPPPRGYPPDRDEPGGYHRAGPCPNWGWSASGEGPRHRRERPAWGWDEAPGMGWGEGRGDYPPIRGPIERWEPGIDPEDRATAFLAPLPPARCACPGRTGGPAPPAGGGARGRGAPSA